MSPARSTSIVLEAPIGISKARQVIEELRAVGRLSFLVDDISIADADFPRVLGHRQVTDAHLLTIARRRGVKLVTVDRVRSELAGPQNIELLRAL